MTESGPSSVFSSAATGASLMRLHRQDDHVMHAGLGEPIRGVHGENVTPSTILAVQGDAHLPGRLEIRTPANERDLVSGQGELESEHAPDRPCTDDANLHDSDPTLRRLPRPLATSGPYRAAGWGTWQGARQEARI